MKRHGQTPVAVEFAPAEYQHPSEVGNARHNNGEARQVCRFVVHTTPKSLFVFKPSGMCV